MGVTKLSIALDSEVAASAKLAAASEGVSLSAWLNRLAEHQLRLQEGLRGVREYEAEFGPISPEARERARAFVESVVERKRARDSC